MSEPPKYSPPQYDQNSQQQSVQPQQYAQSQQYVQPQQYAPSQQFAQPQQQFVQPQMSQPYMQQQMQFPQQYNQFSQQQQAGYVQQPVNFAQQGVQFAQQGGIYVNPDAPPEQRLKDIERKYEISPYYMSKLLNLRGAEFVLAFDNSGSMNSPVKSKNPNIRTRWDEAHMISGIIVDIVTALDPTGVDLFMFNPPTANNEPYRNVKHPYQLKPIFDVMPNGMTPTSITLSRIFKEKQFIAKERKVIVICATDGVATNVRGDPDMAGLKNVLENGRSDKDRIFVNFLLCTDEEEIVEQFAGFDKKIKSVDVTDDYASEKAEIQRRKGNNHAFTMGNYIVKLIVGATDPETDQQDEESNCCVIL